MPMSSCEPLPHPISVSPVSPGRNVRSASRGRLSGCGGSVAQLGPSVVGGGLPHVRVRRRGVFQHEGRCSCSPHSIYLWESWEPQDWHADFHFNFCEQRNILSLGRRISILPRTQGKAEMRRSDTHGRGWVLPARISKFKRCACACMQS